MTSRLCGPQAGRCAAAGSVLSLTGQTKVSPGWALLLLQALGSLRLLPDSATCNCGSDVPTSLLAGAEVVKWPRALAVASNGGAIPVMFQIFPGSSASLVPFQGAIWLH